MFLLKIHILHFQSETVTLKLIIGTIMGNVLAHRHISVLKILHFGTVV